MATEHHIDVNFKVSIDDRLAKLLEELIQTLSNNQNNTFRPAVRAQIVFGGSMSTGTPTTPPQINVDTQGEYAEIQFVDDHGNVTSPPVGATVQFASSDQNIVTVASDATNPLRANISPVGNPGNVDISVTVTGANDPQGNAIPNPSPVTVTVNPGAAAGERLSVTQNQAPAPTPPTPNPPAPNPPAPVTSAQPTQPVYTFTGADPSTIDAAQWASSGFNTDTGQALYYFNGDDANSGEAGTAHGVGAEWQQFTGTVQQGA